MAKLCQFLQGHSKPAFSEKVQTGHQGKFVKNRPKSSPGLKGPKALWCKWHCPLISMHLKCPNSQVIEIFRKVTQWRKWHYPVIIMLLNCKD